MNPNTHKAVKTASHTFGKFPTKHANKAVEGSIPTGGGPKEGKKACRIKYNST